MITKAFTLQEKIAEVRSHQKEWLARCKEKGLDMTWKAHVNKKKSIIFLPINDSLKNSKQAWLEDHI